ncbi:MAG: hypothetical protein K2X32_06345 [Phycisphaerales bacterium]|nr:hypothetical protein [Phycisphaerales bacterium]
MPGAFVEQDIASMLSVSEFGVDVTIAGLPVTAIFDAAYVDPLGVASVRPVLTCATTDVASVVRGAAVVIGSVNYVVRGIEPDGTGVTLLILERV